MHKYITKVKYFLNKKQITKKEILKKLMEKNNNKNNSCYKNDKKVV